MLKKNLTDEIYDADESSLCYRLLPKKALTSKLDCFAKSYKKTNNNGLQ